MNLSKENIATSLKELVLNRSLMGVSFNYEITKKKGGMKKFFIVNPPPVAEMCKIWEWVMNNEILPENFFQRLQITQEPFSHGLPMLLMGEDKIVYNTTIDIDSRQTGELALIFKAKRNFGHNLISIFKPGKLREVHIEDIQLDVQSSGYASFMFKEYEKMFGELGFNRMTLFAALNIGKYFWAKKGYDFIDKSVMHTKKNILKNIAHTKGLPVTDEEISRLNSAYDIGEFGKDKNITLEVYRNNEGYYKLEKSEEYCNPAEFHIGKSFLLSTGPWDGCKPLKCGFSRFTGFIYSPLFLKHNTGTSHPENPSRLKAIIKKLKVSGIFDNLIHIEPCTPDERWVNEIHPAEYLKRLKEAVYMKKRYFDSPDCRLSNETYKASLMAAGAVITGIDAVMNGRIDNGFCAVRPPGHHAGHDRAMGFCFLNNAAIGAKYLQKKHGVERVLIVDWDVHHGNGTEHIFGEDNTVFYASIHEHPTFCYPGTGRKMDTGKGEGTGYTLNLPLNPHATDAECILLFREQLIPEIRKFKPDFILISAGFDAHSYDKIADLNLTEKSYIYMTEQLVKLAGELCRNRILSILEGGYNLSALSSCVEAHIKTLMGGA